MVRGKKCAFATREIFRALVLFNNFVFLRFVHDYTIMVSFEVRSSFSYRHVETRRLHFEREKTQFTMFVGIFYTKTMTMVILRINMRRERRCGEIFRWLLVSQLSEISSVVQPFLFSQLLHVLFSLAFIFFRKATVSATTLSDILPPPCSRYITRLDLFAFVPGFYSRYFPVLVVPVQILLFRIIEDIDRNI